MIQVPTGNLSWCLLLFSSWKKKTRKKENTSKRETKADVGHEPRRCLIKLLMTVVKEQIVLILIALIVCFCFVDRSITETDVFFLLESLRLLLVWLYYMTERGKSRRVAWFSLVSQ